MFSYLCRKRPQRLQKGRRRAEAKKYNRISGRSLRHESLEERRVLTLVGVEPLGDPVIGYNSGGTVAYDSGTDAFSVAATPLSIDSSAGSGLFFSGDLNIDIQVDDTGALIGGVVGDDLVISGDVDIDGDFVVDESGVLLTGEIIQFGSEDSGGTTDQYDYRFQITGGLLTTNALTSAQYAGKDLGITTTSENSDFAGDFSVNFGGNAKGDVGTIDPIAANPDIDIEKLTNGIDADTLPEAVQIDAGDSVVFTYQVTNTGDVPFDFDDVVIVDDNGTPGDNSDDVSTTSGDIVFLAASDVGSDLILSPGETWQYEYATVALDLETGLSDLVTDGTYQLGNHPDGNAGPPLYGLRLDGLTTWDDTDIHTFSFDQADGADVQMVIDGDMITISGTVFGGLVQSNAYVPGESGLWDIEFSYDGAALAAGDDDLQVDDALAGLNTGSITKLFGDLASYDLVDYAGSHSFSFQLGDTDDDSGHRGFDGISGWGWLNHAPENDPAWLQHHLAASDWLFTAEKISDDFYKNTAVVTVPGAEDMDMSHYENPDDPGGGEDAPHISFNSGGTVSYDATTDIFDLQATPLSIGAEVNPAGLFFNGDVLLSFVVDDTGSFVSGIGGDDFVLLGDVDVDGDFVVDFSGVLLTGEVFEFSSTDSGGTTDNYMIRTTVTGGLLSHLYGGQDLKFLVTSESSDFTGDFTTNFGGNAKGDIWPVDPIVDVLASVGNYFFIDKDGNGMQNSGDLGVNGVVVNLLNEDSILIASTVTGFDANGNAGFYLFYNLQAGNYIVEFETPDGVQFTTMDAGDDNRDSDANVGTGRTDLFALGDGEHRRDIDAGILATVQTEEMVYKVEDFYSKHQKKKAGKIKSVDLEYNEAADEFFVSIEFKEHRGRLTDGFTFVVTPGEWPAGQEDKYAMFYFDADVYGRHDGPVLTVYGYNGRYNGQSYRDSDGNSSTSDADRIATSKDNSSGWVKDISVDTYRQNGRWHRTMSFRIVASTVNDHIPLQGGDWEGAQFGNMASFSIDTYDRLYTRYNSDGYLKKWYACYHGWLDADWVHTTCDTVVVEQEIEEFFDDFGWEVSEYQEGISDGDPPEDASDEDSDFNWEGSVDAAMEAEFA